MKKYFILLDEKRDLLLLGLCLIIPLVIWIFVMGWSLASGQGTLISSSDIGNYYLYYQELLRAGGSVGETLFSPYLLGGVPIHPLMGTPLWAKFTSFLGFSPVFYLNSLVIIIQLCFSFLSVVTVRELAQRFSSYKTPSETPTPLLLPLLPQISLIIFFAFMPALAWRITFGHLYLIMGIFPLLSSLALIASTANKKLTLTLFLVAVLANCCTYPSHGQQLIVYSLCLGFPLILAFIWTFLRSESGKSLTIKKLLFLLLPTFLMHFISLCLIAPDFYYLVSYLLSGDGARTVGENMVYSYTTATVEDWYNFFFLKNNFIESSRALFYHHETNYPLGPLWLLLLLIPSLAKMRKIWAIALGLTLFLILIFTMNIEPLSNFLLTIFSPLLWFRVPARATLILNLIIPILGLAALVASCHFSLNIKTTKITKTKSQNLLFVGLLSLFLAFAPPIMNEIAVWFLIIFVIVQKFRESNSHNKKYLWGTEVLLLLGISMLPFFKERLNPFPNVTPTVTLMEQIQASIQKQYPDISDPFTKSSLYFQGPSGPSQGGSGSENINFFYNKGMSVKWPTFEGYHPPPKRLLSLLSHLSGETWASGTMSLNLPPNSPLWGILAPLYNVRFTVMPGGNSGGGAGQLQVKDNLSQMVGRAWFSDTLTFFDSEERLFEQMKTMNNSSFFKEQNMMFLEEGAIASKKELSGDCRASQVKSINFGADSMQTITVHVENHGDNCPLSIPLNYYSFWRARASTASELDGVELHPFAAYGTILGVQVPKESETITFYVNKDVPILISILQFVGTVVGIILVSILCFCCLIGYTKSD